MAAKSLLVAYTGTDRFGQCTVMVSKEMYDPSRPGLSRGVTQSFTEARDDAHAKAIANGMKAQGKVDLVKHL